jgi:altered-inheritance-of-mitochondria protein 13
MSRLQQETARLRHEEAQILSAISAALEKENLDKEKPGMSSELLSRDIEEIKEKITRMTEKRKDILEGEGDKAGVRQAREDVVKCYR